MQLFVRVGDSNISIDADPYWRIGDVIGSLQQRRDEAVPSFSGLTLAHTGRPVRGTLAESGVQGWDVLEVVPRLLGGGGDGGSTGAESRSCYLEMYLAKKPDKVNPEEERLARWTTCHISGELLQPPVVADRLGNLYNKEAVLQGLLSKTLPPGLEHIHGLKSVTELKLELPSDGDAVGARFVCPITGLAANGKARFLFNTASGYVVSERALKEVPKVVEETAGAKSGEGTWIPLNPSEEEQEKLRAALPAPPEKKSKKKKDKRVEDGVAPLPGSTFLELGPPLSKKIKVQDLAPVNADKKIWNSLFSSKRDPNAPEQSDGYMTRGVASRGMKMG